MKLNAVVCFVIYVVLSFALVVLPFALIISGTITLRNTNDVKILPGFKMQNCTLLRSDIVKLKDCRLNCDPKVDCYPKSEWVVVWKIQNGKSAISSPFSSQLRKKYAQTHQNDYPLNTIIPCMCNPTLKPSYPNLTDLINCDIWGSCMLNTQLVLGLQKDGGYTAKVGNILLAVGLEVSSILILLTILFSYCFKCTNNYKIKVK